VVCHAEAAGVHNFVLVVSCPRQAATLARYGTSGVPDDQDRAPGGCGGGKEGAGERGEGRRTSGRLSTCSWCWRH